MQPENNLNPQRLRSMEPVKSSYQPPPVDHRPDYPPPSPPPHHKNHFNRWRSIISTLLLFLIAPAIALFIAAFVVQSYQVDGQSMEPTLQDNDRLIVDKWQRSWARITNHAYIPHRGDIVIFNQGGIDFAGGPTKQLIKRVVGLPGERVVVKDGKIAIYNQQESGGFNPDTSGEYPIITTVTPGNVDVSLETDEIFVVGDNRTNSEDSRYFGAVNADQIAGKLAFRIVPLDKAQKF